MMTLFYTEQRKAFETCFIFYYYLFHLSPATKCTSESHFFGLHVPRQSNEEEGAVRKGGTWADGRIAGRSTRVCFYIALGGPVSQSDWRWDTIWGPSWTA